MTAEARVPNDPLVFICEKVRARAVLWTYHVNIRLRDRFIPRESILGSVDTYDVIESYPDDKYLPSYLVFARHGGDVVHILFAVDVQTGSVSIVTAYRPNPDEWEADQKTRKKAT
jgi:hypothetical protein